MMSFDDAAPDPLVGLLDPSRLKAVLRGLERAREQTEAGHYTAALVTATHAHQVLGELVRDAAAGPDYAQAIRMAIIEEWRVPVLDHERDTREAR